jgi:hypothetical protein
MSILVTDGLLAYRSNHAALKFTERFRQRESACIDQA